MIRSLVCISIVVVTSGLALPKLTSSPNHPHPSAELGRREALQHVIQTSVLAIGSIALPAQAEEGKQEVEQRQTLTRPFAPLEALLPAARVKLVIQRAIAVTTDLVRLSSQEQGQSSQQQKKQDLLNQLDNLLLAPQNYTRLMALSPVPAKPAKKYLESYQQNRQQLPLLAQPGAMLVQSGEIGAWKRLKRRERRSEEQDEIRAALNVFTNALNFDPDRYILTAPVDVRKQLIREDRIPDIKSVIASDMGMRYLYRNELLSAMDEAKAELRFQLEQNGEVDVTDLLDLLYQAEKACAKWFALIDESNVQEAMEVVQRE